MGVALANLLGVSLAIATASRRTGISACAQSGLRAVVARLRALGPLGPIRPTAISRRKASVGTVVATRLTKLLFDARSRHRYQARIFDARPAGELEALKRDAVALLRQVGQRQPRRPFAPSSSF